ncbi:hypothetical protein KFE25_012776 [Diacronema lutheri]|uniref:START domain-containing protein n=1 Tax=Diacronema lutheri TaxID=2081491 RepID=A0A8J5X4J0_DIALT|nr:hypothetical protein KFE25_012776 [Diacronema lutheri]
MDLDGAWPPPSTALLVVHCAVVLVLLMRLTAAARRHSRAWRASDRAEPHASACAAPRSDGAARAAAPRDVLITTPIDASGDGSPTPTPTSTPTPMPTPTPPMPPPLSELEEGARLLDDHFGRRVGFELVLRQPDLRFLKKELSPCASHFLTEGVAACTPAEFVRLWTDAEFRQEWDRGLLSLQPLSAGGGALCHVIKCPYPLASRHYVYDRHVCTLPNGVTVIHCTSAVARLAALGVSSTVRSSVLCAAFHSLTAVRPATDGSGRCEYAMLTFDEQPVRLPGWLLDSLLRRTYPAFMESVRQAVELLRSRRPRMEGAERAGSADSHAAASGGGADGELAAALHERPALRELKALAVPSPPPVPARAHLLARAPAATALPARLCAPAAHTLPRAAALVARGASAAMRVRRSLGSGAAGAPVSVSVAS